MKLFDTAEALDINASPSIGDDSQAGLDVSHALRAGTFALGFTNAANPSRPLAFAEGALAQFAILSARSQRRLPRWYIIRAYGEDRGKAGALSVRVYAHGRAYRAPLKEISHFSLRLQGSAEPKRFNQHIWYGRTLKRTIDIEFFQVCLNACEDRHGDPFNSFRWLPRSNVQQVLHKPDFRLIDVQKMCIVETSFEDIIHGGPYPTSYVALRYVRGKSSLPDDWTEHVHVTTTDDNDDIGDNGVYFYQPTTRRST